MGNPFLHSRHVVADGYSKLNICIARSMTKLPKYFDVCTSRTYSVNTLQKCITTNSLSCLNITLSKGIKTSNISHHVAAAKTTVDAADVERHSKQAKDWWDENGLIKALHSYNLIRVPFIRDGLVYCSPNERVPMPLSGKKVLDVGCGGGILTEAIARLGAKVTGVDASKELIELARDHSSVDQKLANNRPSYECTTIEEHSNLFTEHYDAVVASEIIEHVDNKEIFIQACVKAVKPGGKIFITTPNRTRAMQLFGIIIAENITKSLPRGTHEYDKFITPNEVTFMLERNNCHVQLIHGLMYFPVVNKWTWCSSTAFMYALQAVKLQE